MENMYQIGAGPKRLFVLGATGGTGAAFIDRALEAGHSLTAFVRSPQRVRRSHERLRVVAGDVRDAGALAAAARGHDAIVTAIGARERGPTTIAGDSARATVAAMIEAGVMRLVMVSAALLYPTASLLYRIGNYFLRDHMRDLAVAEAAIGASDRAFTIVRPPRLTNGAGGRAPRVTESGPPKGLAISRADLADFLLDVVEHDRFVRHIVGVSR